MNTAKITALYPYFLDCLKHFSTNQTLVDMLVKRLQSDALPTGRRYSIALTDQDNPDQHADWLAEVAGVTMQEFTTQRVFDWVRQQLPDGGMSYQPKPASGWHVYLQASSRSKAAANDSLHLYAAGSADELAAVLRGLRAYQTKRRKLACRLATQLWTYHLEQEQARAAAAIPTPSVMPAVSCSDLPSEEYFRRVDAAEDREEQLQQQHSNEARYGREILWHPSFAAHCVEVVSNLPLVEVTTWLAQLPGSVNQGRALDRYDFAYLADLLREGLASSPPRLAELRLARALAAVERAGTVLLTEWATPTPAAVAADAPIMTASAA